MRLINYLPNNSLFNLFNNIEKSFDYNFQDNFIKPKALINELDDSYIISLEMPGVSKKDVDITINNDVINIKSQRKENDSKDFYLENQYSRSFYVPDNANIDKIKAKSLNGILTINIPKLKKIKKNIKKIDIS